jgi:hypothetical protein
MEKSKVVYGSAMTYAAENALAAVSDRAATMTGTSSRRSGRDAHRTLPTRTTRKTASKASATPNLTSVRAKHSSLLGTTDGHHTSG